MLQLIDGSPHRDEVFFGSLSGSRESSERVTFPWLSRSEIGPHANSANSARFLAKIQRHARRDSNPRPVD
jgi:hypothetical protein